MTLLELMTEAAGRLRDAGVPDWENDARLLLFAAFDLDMTHYLLERQRPLPDCEDVREKAERCRSMVKERCRRIPLQQILEVQEFMGLEFYVNNHVLIPRQDTETLAELVLAEQKDPKTRILDLCTGSGCIGISLAVKGGFDFVAAADISEKALAVAGRNWERLRCGPGEMQFFLGDLFEAVPPETEPFDVIVSNPPYIPTEVIRGLEPEVRDHEPVLALDGTEDGLEFYRRIAGTAGSWLRDGGSLYLEIGYDQGQAVSGLLQAAGFEDIRVIKDLPGLDRVVYAVWRTDRRKLCSTD
ncbi:MAG: peptide chain release factor N(5)-glutamine methyltransferase [Eubacteriales bacterium]|nr:peptide chain release factor N(5)-glutamine methyltransferase [Eubacteriales bacterium]